MKITKKELFNDCNIMNEDLKKIKNIISFFLGIETESINKETVIDNTILQGSVKIHIMYGDLADNGYKVANYSKIKTFGELLSNLNLIDEINTEVDKECSINPTFKDINLSNKFDLNNKKRNSNSISIGVDILQINKLPIVVDFRESKFYTDNFSIREFAYCLLKPDPYKCFAGKFTAKEAVVKANNDFKNVNFKDIEILNDENGKPIFNNFSISISYEDDYAIAIAYYNCSYIEKKPEIFNEENNINTQKKHLIIDTERTEKCSQKTNSYKALILLSLFLNILTIAYIIYITGKFL